MATFKNAKKLNDEELKQVNGGGIVYTGWKNRNEPYRWDVIDERDGRTVQIIVRRTWDDARNAALDIAKNWGYGTRELTWEEVEQLRNNRS